MRFSEEARGFLALGVDRLEVLSGMLEVRGVGHRILKTGSARHLVARFGKRAPELVLVAHYDRVVGSPGVLDNSCACLQLVELSARLVGGAARARRSPSLLIVFTDAEEAPASRGAESQGAYALARALKAAESRSARSGAAATTKTPPVLVLDVTGRGNRLALSSAPAVLLERNALGDTELASGHGRLVELASRAARRARLPDPARLPLPWSDDLGLVLGGVPALVATLLPEPELEGYAAALAPRREREPPTRSNCGAAWPATWDLINGPDDAPERAEEASFDLMRAFLDAVVAELDDI